jgi:hypothetical protein
VAVVTAERQRVVVDLDVDYPQTGYVTRGIARADLWRRA